MAIPTWQPGRLYQPGDIVLPITMPAPTAAQVENGDWSAGNVNWDYTGGAQYSTTGGYGNRGPCVVMPGSVPEGLALNKSILVLPQNASSFEASAMIQQGASIAGATRGWVEVRWFDSEGVLVDSQRGNIVSDGSGGAWHKSSLTATRPLGAAYARAGIGLFSVADHTHEIFGDNLAVSGTFAGLPDGLVYKAVQQESGFSANTEPVWPPILGQTVVDNDVIWEAVASTRVTWEASPLYVSGATEPEWPSDVGSYIKDGTINWRAVSRRVEDENCPNTKYVAIAASKVFAGDDDIVRYSATVNPLDWSAQEDAGYLPFGLQNYGANPVAAMGLYRGNLAVFNSEGFQLWQVDEDPASMALIDALPLGSEHHHAIAPVSNDLLFLAAQGVRSIGIAASSTNFQAGDVGMPIDPLVQEAVLKGDAPLSLYYPARGQYWLIFPNMPEPVQTGVIPAVIGTAVTNTITIPDSYQSAYIFPLKAGGIGAASAASEVAVDGQFGYRYYDYLLAPKDQFQTLIWKGAALGDSRLFLRAMREDLIAVSADDNFGYCKRISGGTYTGYYQPTGVGTSWWYNEQGFSPEFGGLVWFSDDSLYIGVRQTSQAFNTLYRFPLNPAGNAVPQTALLTPVGSAISPYFWMTRARSGEIHVVTQDGRFRTYNADLELLDDRAFGLPLAGFRGFGVDMGIICAVYATTGGVSAGCQFASTDDWSLRGGRILNASMDGNQATRVLFDDQSCYIQCRNWVGRIEYRPEEKLYDRFTTAFVYSMTSVGQVGAWSRYVFPFVIDDWAIRGDDLFLRSGSNIHKMDDDVVGDEVDSGEIVPFEGRIQWPWLDFGQPGVTKSLYGFDIVGSSDVFAQFGYDQSNLGTFTAPYRVPADTVPGMVIPMPISAPTISVRLTYDGTSAWQWNAFSLYLQDLRGMS